MSKIDQLRSKPVYWRDLLAQLKTDYDQDPAKHALIAELAEDIIPSFERIAISPKMVLNRIRDQERVQSVREMDKRCLIDLARRPGSSIPEKAGSRQRVLSIKRHESADVLENRVYLHCCELLLQASQRYLDAHHDILSSKRRHMVSGLSRCCKRWLGTEALREVTHLRSPCRTPNYVLLQNIYYAKVWGSYIRLLRNEQLRDVLWRWSRRLWSDFVALYLADTLLEWRESLNLPISVEIGEKIVQAEKRPRFGKWFVSDILPGPFVLGFTSENSGTLYLVDGVTTDFLGSDASCLLVLNADYLLVWLNPEGDKVLPVYTQMDDGSRTVAGPRETFSERATSLLAEVEEFNSSCHRWQCLGAWILLGKKDEKRRGNLDLVQKDQLYCWRSTPSTDPIMWNEFEQARFKPLSKLTGLGDHEPRN